jgi:DNA-binding winged helix-turn-helix (wHTH) protein
MTARFRFDGWLLDTHSGELSKGEARQRLQDHPLQVLLALLERPGEIVTREQLITRLWPTGVVDFDTGLNAAVRRLRVALGDEAEHPRYIETLPRRGYRFIGALQPDQTSAVLAATPPAGRVRAAPRLWLVGTLVLGGVAAALLTLGPWRSRSPGMPPGEKSIAVLPFVDLSAEPKQVLGTEPSKPPEGGLHMASRLACLFMAPLRDAGCIE